MKKLLSILLVLITVVGTISVSMVGADAATQYNVSVKTGSYYTVKNKGSGKMLNVYGNRNANNTNITVYQADKTSGQNFKFAKSGSCFTITPQCATSRVLNVYGNSAANNSNVCLWSKTGHNTQSWIIEYVPAKSGYVIRSANNKNYVLAATGSANSSNVCLKKYNSSDNYQIWTSGAFSVSVTSSANNTNTVPAGKITTAQIQAVLNKYGYKDGRYWTIKETRKNNDCSAKSKTVSADLYASDHAASANGSYKSFNYEGQWQCHGFASYVMAKVTGTTVRPTNSVGEGWNKIAGESNIKSLQVGDIVRTTQNKSYHTAIVLSVDSNGKCTFAEAWGSRGCEINIGKFNGRYSTLSELKNAYNVEYVFRYNG